MRSITPLILLTLLLTLSTPALAADPIPLSAIEQRLSALDAESKPEIQQAAMRSLVELGSDATAALCGALADPERSWEVRTGIAWVLGELAEPDSKAALEKALGADPKAPGTFRVQVAIALAAQGTPKPLRAMLGDTDKILVAKAATALANYRDIDAIPALKPLVADEDIGAFIALALGRLGDDSGRDKIKGLMTEAMFRDYCAVALAGIGDKTALLPLRYALDNADPFLRRDAATFLGRFEDKGSLGKLEQLVKKDPDPRVRKAAERAVKKIERAQRRRR